MDAAGSRQRRAPLVAGSAGVDAGGRCQSCSVPLAADNNARLCGKCHREQHDQLRDAPAAHSRDFFETDQFRAAFRSRDMGRVFTAYRAHPRHLKMFGKALNQETLGRWLGLTQAQVSKIENRSRPETRLDILIDWAKFYNSRWTCCGLTCPTRAALRATIRVGRGRGRPSCLMS